MHPADLRVVVPAVVVHPGAVLAVQCPVDVRVTLGAHLQGELVDVRHRLRDGRVDPRTRILRGRDRMPGSARAQEKCGCGNRELHVSRLAVTSWEPLGRTISHTSLSVVREMRAGSGLVSFATLARDPGRGIPRTCSRYECFQATEKE